MRIIKFKFWTPDGLMFDDHEGWTEGIGINGALEASAVYGYIPLQFTGLLDKNGREIFEGDVVIHLGNTTMCSNSECESADDSLTIGRFCRDCGTEVVAKDRELQAVVEYSQEYASFRMRGATIFLPSDYVGLHEMTDKKAITVIGNIYENADLLK